MHTGQGGMTIIGRIARRLGSGPSPSTADVARNPSCSEFEVDAWQLSQFVLDKLVPAVGIHPFPLHELMLLSAATCKFRPPLIFEWGTHIGKSARAFYEVLTHYNIPGEIHSVDLPDDVRHVEHPSDERGRLVRGLDRVHLHQGDGVDVSVALWKQRDRPRGVLFLVDGDHAFDSVYRELSIIVREIPDANVLLHDTFFQSAASGYNIGPWRAIEEVMHANPGRFKRMDSGLGLPGMTLLYGA